MIITCQQCETSFNLDEGLLKPAGSKVRCSKCKHIFTAYPPAPAEKVEETAAGPAETDIAEKGIEETAETSLAAETRDEAEIEEELDLSDIDDELKLTDEAGEAAAVEPSGEDLSLDFDLDDEEKEPAPAEAGSDCSIQLRAAGSSQDRAGRRKPVSMAAGNSTWPPQRYRPPSAVRRLPPQNALRSGRAGLPGCRSGPAAQSGRHNALRKRRTRLWLESSGDGRGKASRPTHRSAPG